MEHCQNQCMVCENSYYSLEEFVCGLTDKVEVFEDECASFVLDWHQLYRKRKPFESTIGFSPSLVRRILDHGGYKKGGKPQVFTHYRSKRDTFGVHFKEYDNEFDVMSFFFKVISLFAITLFLGIVNKPKNGETFFFLLILGLVVAVCYAIYRIYFYKEKEKKYILIKEKEIVYNGKIIFWNDILGYGFSRYEQSVSLILYTMSKGVVEIRISDIDVEKDQLVEIIELNKKDYLFND